MPLSPNILSLEPKEVSSAILAIYDQNANPESGKSNPAARALMHRMVDYIVTANENKEGKKTPLLFTEFEAEILAEESSTDYPAQDTPAFDPIEYAKLLAKKLTENVYTPALTAHPTNPKSIETDRLLVNIYDLLMLLRNEMAAGVRDPKVQEEKNKTIKGKLEKLAEERPNLTMPALGEESEKEYLLKVAQAYLAQCCTELSQTKLVPDNKLTVPQEVDRNLQIFGKFFGEFNKFKHRIINQFCERYGIEDASQAAEIARILTPAIAGQFQQIHFWSGSDADGNAKITAETMLAAVKAHQQFLDNLYLGEIAKLKIQFAENEFVLAELIAIEKIVAGERGLEAAGAVASEKDSAEIVRRIDGIIERAAPEHKELTDLRDSFDCFGFVGPKMDVRQSSVRNVTSMQQILDFLRAIETKGVENFAGKYADKSFKKEDFCKFLQTPEMLELLAQEGTLEGITTLAEKSFPPESAKIAQQEIRRMMVAKRYPDIFHRYIISDNKGIESWNEVRTFEAIAHRIEHGAGVEDQRPLQVYPLCETSADIRNLPIMIATLLADPKAVAQLKGRLDLFVGYSDAEKRSGTFALLLLQQKILESLEIINHYNESVPEGQKLRVEIFQGRGNDLIRGGGKPYHSATDQGQGAIDLGFGQKAKAALLASAGRVDDFDLQMKQWEKLTPAKRTSITEITEKAVTQFEELVSHKPGKTGHGDELAAFLEAISMNAALKETNQSSRAPAKGTVSKDLNLDSERAIGLATRFSACGLPFNLLGLGQISNDDCAELSSVCQDLTVVQDVILKTVYALATSDAERARKIAKINGASSEQTAKLFAEFDALSFQALENVVESLPLDDFRAAEILAKISDEHDRRKPVNEVAKLVMAQLASEFPLIKKLQDSVVAFEEGYKPVVHKILDQYSVANPEQAVHLDQQLAILFREEMRIPREIDGLTSKTQFATRENVVAAQAQQTLPLAARAAAVSTSLC